VNDGAAFDLQLYLSGEMSGEMFIGALLDAFPDYEDLVVEAIDAACEKYPVDCRLETSREREVRGRRFLIEPYTRYFGVLEVCPADERESWSALRSTVVGTVLPGGAGRHAVALLMLIARHHAVRHDLSVDAVTFPRNEAWHMLAQVVGAAVVIDSLGNAQWSAHTLGRELATPVGRAILAYVGALPDRHAPRDVAIDRSVLVSGVGLSAQSGSSRERYLRVDCTERLGGGVAASHGSAIQVGPQQGTRGESFNLD
jgi:uncharacterized protein (DUF111 family)